MVTKRNIPPYEKFGVAVPVTDARLRLHSWREGDRLSVLAEQYLGDWMRWRMIADRNKLADPRKVAVGTILVIPDIPLEEGDLVSR
jgi:nucleoid-associated protein YgaU